MVMIPLRLPHRFSNPFDEEAVFLNTTSPAHYVRYFQYLEELVGEGTELTPEVNAKAMLKYGTVPLLEPDVKLLEKEAEQRKPETANGSNGVNGAHGDASFVEKRFSEIKAELSNGA